MNVGCLLSTPTVSTPLATDLRERVFYEERTEIDVKAGKHKIDDRCEQSFNVSGN